MIESNGGRLHRSKVEARRNMRALLAGLSPEDRNDASARIAKLLLDSPCWSGSPILFSFLSLPNEIDTEWIHRKALACGKTIGIPKIAGNRLSFRLVRRPRAIRSTNRFGIREPSERAPVIDAGSGSGVLILVPGLAFDLRGRRLGRGGGYYDRLLAEHPRAAKIGICFDLQVVDRVPSDLHDVPVEWVATERGILRAAGGS